MERNPNLAMPPPEATERFEPSDRLFRQIGLRGGPFVARLKDLYKDKELSFNQVGGPQVWNQSGVTATSPDASFEDFSGRNGLIRQFLEQGGGEEEDSTRGMYYVGDAPKDRSLGTLAHESIHGVQDLMTEGKVGTIEAFYSRTLDDLMSTTPYLATSVRKSKGDLKKYEGMTFANFGVAYLHDNFEDLIVRSAKEEEQNYIEQVEGAYQPMRDEDVPRDAKLAQAEDLELRIARWKRDAEEAGEKDMIQKLNAFQKDVRKYMVKQVKEDG